MSWRDWLGHALGLKASATTRAVVLLAPPGLPVSTPRNYEQLAREGYEANATVYACINEIAKSLAGLRWMLVERRRKREEEIEKHPLLTLLARPNPWESGGRFFENVAGLYMISGNCYIERVGPGNGRGQLTHPPRELYTLRPDRVGVLTHETERIAGYRYEAGGVKVEYLAPMVLHLKRFHPTNDWYGLSPIQVAATTIDTDNAATTWNFSLLKNSARPSGAMVVEGKLDDAQFARLKDMIKHEYGGAERAGAPLLLEGGMDWKQLSLTPSEMDFIEARKMSKQDIAMAYGVPAELIGLKEATYENRREARRAFYTETALPLADLVRDELNHWLTPLFGENLRLDYDRDAIEALQEDREKLWARIQKAEWLTLNEKRVATGYDERPDGEVLLVPFSLAPLGEAGQTGTSFSELNDAGEGPGASGEGESRGFRKSDLLPLASRLTPDTVREREWKARVLQFLPIEQRYSAALQRYFTAQRDDVLARLRAGSGFAARGKGQERKDIEEILFDLDEQTGKIRDVSRAQFEEAAKRGGEAIFAEVRASGSFESGSPESRIRIDYQLRQLRGIPERIRHRLEQEIAAGLSADESPAQIADRVKGFYKGLTGARAQTIARTEVARAYNEARFEAMRQLGIEMTEWLTARDERIRDLHQIDGQRRRLGETFSNDLRFPSDPTGAPHNVINCRCVAIPVNQNDTSGED